MTNPFQILIGLMLIQKYEPASPVKIGYQYEPGRTVRTGICLKVEAGDSPEEMTEAEFAIMLQNGWNINHENNNWEYKA